MNLGGLVPVDRFEIPCSFAKISLPFLKIPCGLGSHRKAESSPHWEGRLRSATACTRGHPAIHQRDPSVTVTARMVSTEPGAGHGVVLPAVKIIARETKRLGWDDRSLREDLASVVLQLGLPYSVGRAPASQRLALQLAFHYGWSSVLARHS